ncbi:MAG: CopD family protein [Luteimonas sp.]|nr:CopD family protein [Luteimonas sp.]
MADAPLYLLRLPQYLALMLLFGLPLLQWRAGRALRDSGDAEAAGFDPRPLRSWLLACALAALALNAAEAPLKAMRLLWLSLPELDAASLAWYVFDTAAGRAWLVRGMLLLAVAGVLVAASRGSRGLPVRGLCVLSGLALATLLWNGHAAASAGAAGVLRLGLGGLHLLAAAAWLGAIAGFLAMLAGDWPRRGDIVTLRRWHARLHAFATTGGALVAVLVASGIVHYAWIIEWRWSPATLLATPYGRWMLFKLAMFAAMLALAALHRWILVPRLAVPDGHPDDPVRLRRSLRLEAAAAVLVVAAVAVAGTMSPHG